MPQELQFIFDRREAKFPLGPQSWESAVRAAEHYLPVERFDGVHGLVQIRTTYLDTPELASYREYCEARPLRRKLRIRQYGYEGRFNGRCWIEVKIKQYDQSLKRRFACSLDAASSFLTGCDILEDVRASNGGRAEAVEVYEAARAYARRLELRPVVRVDYERIAFRDGTDAAGRITVDRDIRFRLAQRAVTGSMSGVLLEVKYAGEPPPWLNDLADDLSLPSAQRFSKYAQGIERLMASAVGRGAA